MLPIRAPGVTLTEFYSFGYQYSERGYSGYSVAGRINDIAIDTRTETHQPLLVLAEAAISDGLSGAPVFSLADRSVVGVVKRSNPDGGGYAVPIESVEKLLPGTLAQNAQLTLSIHSNLALDRYLDDLQREHSYVSLADLRRDVQLDQIYVTLTLAPESITTARR